MAESEQHAVGHVNLRTADEVELQGRWDVPPAPRTCLVFCHPHPLHRGTMNAPLMEAVTTGLVGAGIAVLRFNFRGVAGSGGSHGDGVAEQHDVQAAMEEAVAKYPRMPLRIAGWSFGAATALAWQASTGSVVPYAGIAPPFEFDRAPHLPPPAALEPAERLFVLGDRDQFTTVAQLSGYAESIDAALEVIKGSDHFFLFREDRVAATIAERFA